MRAGAAEPERESRLETVLVTGATGFLGRALVARLLERGAVVRALARGRTPPPPEWKERHRLRLAHLDLSRQAPPPELLEGCAVVFHLAGRAHQRAGPGAVEERLHRAHNLEATQRLLAAASAAGVRRIVYASSVKAMGEATGAVPVGEDAPPRPEGPYGRSKLAAERALLEAGSGDGGAGTPQASVLRLPLLYGPGVAGNLGAMLRAVARSRFPSLPELGDRRSLLHVEDAARALLACASSGRAAGRVYLVTDGHHYSTRGIYDSMLRALGRPPPRWCIPLPVLAGLARAGDALEWLNGCLRPPAPSPEGSEGPPGAGVLPVPFSSRTLAKLRASALYDDSRIRAELRFTPLWSLESALPEMVAGLPVPPGAGAR